MYSSGILNGREMQCIETTHSSQRKVPEIIFKIGSKFSKKILLLWDLNFSSVEVLKAYFEYFTTANNLYLSFAYF